MNKRELLRRLQLLARLWALGTKGLDFGVGELSRRLRVSIAKRLDFYSLGAKPPHPKRPRNSNSFTHL